MGFFKATAKAFEASTDWGANNLGQGRVMASTKTSGKSTSSSHCAHCGRKATRTTAGIGHCARTACLRALGDLF